ncbi:MAG: tRNA (cytidine(34)-2'-O)-methyltransferase [Eubacterium sp.]|nr:tRNA (cytidine(34)-2'-O)-methyltransferase [Eubacterium sp.]MBQ7199955.1 tRNA (cytidine(34)-2'-O)-methyltransferase [Eubacterium sp.]
MSLNIVLLEPEIPQNTGNIGRTCVATGTRLHLIEPMGFQVTDKWVRRAGLDYWDKLDVTVYDSYPDFLYKNFGVVSGSADVGQVGLAESVQPDLYFASTKARHVYSDVSYSDDCYIMFGKESAGIPEEILVEHPDRCIRIPMWGDIRSLNLSNSVAIVTYEVMRQWGFDGLNTKGELHRLKW